MDHRKDLSSRVLIAGGSSGMGEALARRMLQEGAEVTIIGRSRERLWAARQRLPCSERLRTYAADITREDEVAHLFDEIDQLNHIACTAADFEGAYEFLADLKLTAVQRAVESKILGPIMLAKYGVPRLSRSGSITFTSGIAAYRPAARGTVVAAINAALEGLARALAIELAPIRVNVVSPGWVDTPIWRFVAGDAKDERLNAMATKLPVGRVGQPDDIADAIRFLIGNGFTTGTVLHVEGGHRLV